MTDSGSSAAMKAADKHKASLMIGGKQLTRMAIGDDDVVDRLDGIEGFSAAS